ncbi:MAG: hypothetical protein ABWX56_04545 [Mycetocola sp.]
MTIEAVHSTSRAEKPDSTVWVPVATGLWAGNTAGNFIGLIERVSTHGYSARNGRSETVGLYSSLAEAKRAVERP